MANPLRKTLWLTLGVALGASLTLGHTVFADRGNNKAEVAEKLPLEQLRTFTDVYSRIKSNYVEEVEDKKLLDSAIKGMLNGLDPHSAYLDKEGYKQLQIGTQGEFGGLGIQVSMDNGFVKVISPIDDTPAERAGVEAGDLIVRLDGKPVKGMSLNDAVHKMRGEPGTDIDLTIMRKDQDKPVQLTITRDTIEVSSVKSRMLEPGYGYIRITNFQTKTDESVNEALRELTNNFDDNLDGLVLDLRNNPGGVLSSAVGVASTLLDKGLVVYTQGRGEDSKREFSAKAGDALDGAPVVVLVNQGSASASEIVSGALQDHKRAVVVGKETFGKASVQTIQRLSNGGALKLTTARYYTPEGRSIQAEGIKPDIRTGNYKLSAAKGNGVGPLKEADLARHLDNPDDESDPSKASGKGSDDASDMGDEEQLATHDYGLYAGLNILKALSLAPAQSGANQ